MVDLDQQIFFMIDMDATLLESIDPFNPLYQQDNGIEVSYFHQGKEQKVKFKIRPFAQKFLNTIIEWGEYVLFSSGIKEYVEAVMEVFSAQVGIYPQRILTRRDMIATFSEPNQKFKSVEKLALESGKKILFIVEDNPNLIIKNERKYILEVKPWLRMQDYDRDLYWLSKLIPVLLQQRSYEPYLLPSSFKKVISPSFVLRGN